MPFKPDLDELYLQSIKPTVERTRRLKCVRADEIYGPRPIMSDIWQSIRESVLVIADLTGRNPNVLYELGLAHAIQKPVILLTQTIDDVPFDLRHVRVLVYRNTNQGRAHLQNEILKSLRAVLHESEVGDVPRHYLVLEPHEPISRFSQQRQDTVLHRLTSKDPRVVVAALTTLADARSERDVVGGTDPRVSAAALSLLQSSYAEVQLAAIRVVGAIRQRVHASNLYPYLTSTNPALLEATITALGEIRDATVVPRLVNILSDPLMDSVHETVVIALGSIGDKRAVAVLAELIKKEDADREEREAAIRALGMNGDSRSLDVLLGVDIIYLGADDRAALATSLGESDGVYRLEDKKRLANRMNKLLSDTSVQVRGAALTA